MYISISKRIIFRPRNVIRQVINVTGNIHLLHFPVYISIFFFENDFVNRTTNNKQASYIVINFSKTLDFVVTAFQSW